VFLCSKDVGLTQKELSKILPIFQTKEIPKLQKFYNYYIGRQAIFLKERDEGKPNNKIVVNYCHTITENFQGYITGIPITYSNDNFEEVQDILNYNDVVNEDSELLKQALIYGKAFEINYIDEEGKQRFKVLDTRECIDVYADDLNNDLLYVIRFYREDLIDKNNEDYIVEVYGPNTVTTYKSTPGFASFQFLNEVQHYYGQCPITVFRLNSDEDSIFGQIISLQDAYNSLLSDEIDDFDDFADAYLVLTGQIADEEDLRLMKKNKCLLLDEGCTANYLTKSISDTQITNMLQNINNQIYNKANCPDLNDENFMSQSGIAIRYKLVGFENKASSIEANMKKALQRRIELISAIINLTDEVMWREVDIKFTRNLPVELSESANIVNQLKGIVSDETLLSLLPFIEDPKEEVKRMDEQNKKNMEMYGFNNQVDDDEQVLEEER